MSERYQVVPWKRWCHPFAPGHILTLRNRLFLIQSRQEEATEEETSKGTFVKEGEKRRNKKKKEGKKKTGVYGYSFSLKSLLFRISTSMDTRSRLFLSRSTKPSPFLEKESALPCNMKRSQPVESPRWIPSRRSIWSWRGGNHTPSHVHGCRARLAPPG